MSFHQRWFAGICFVLLSVGLRAQGVDQLNTYPPFRYKLKDVTISLSDFNGTFHNSVIIKGNGEVTTHWGKSLGVHPTSSRASGGRLNIDVMRELINEFYKWSFFTLKKRYGQSDHMIVDYNCYDRDLPDSKKEIWVGPPHRFGSSSPAPHLWISFEVGEFKAISCVEDDFKCEVLITLAKYIYSVVGYENHCLYTRDQ